MLDHHHLLDELERRVEAARLAVSERRQECARLRARLYELEATRLELLEENRELDEQNSELEAHNRHLLEKLAAGETHGSFPPPARRAQGLAALIGHRPRPHLSTPASPPTIPTATAARHETTPDASSTAHEPHASTTPKAEQKAEQKPPQEATQATQTAPHEPRQEEAPSPQALLAQWYQRYPTAFFKGHTRPLKVGIHHDLTAREPWPEKLVRRALAGYVNLPRYLKAVREGGERIDLDGLAAGTVDAEAAEHARQKLERLQAGRTDHARQGRFREDATRRDTPRKEAAESDKSAARKAHAGKPENATPAAQKPNAREPAAKQSPEPPATLEDKLSALLAKHNRQS